MNDTMLAPKTQFAGIGLTIAQQANLADLHPTPQQPVAVISGKGRALAGYPDRLYLITWTPDGDLHHVKEWAYDEVRAIADSCHHRAGCTITLHPHHPSGTAFISVPAAHRDHAPTVVDRIRKLLPAQRALDAATLADLHDRGVLTSIEYAAATARLNV